MISSIEHDVFICTAYQVQYLKVTNERALASTRAFEIFYVDSIVIKY